MKSRIISFKWCSFLMVSKVGISPSCGWSVRQTNQWNAIKIEYVASEPRKISYENAFHMNENHRNATNSLILAFAMKCNFKISVLFVRGIPRNDSTLISTTLYYILIYVMKLYFYCFLLILFRANFHCLYLQCTFNNYCHWILRCIQ